MPMPAEQIRQLIETNIEGASVRIDDLAGDGDHYAATVTAPGFAGKNRVQQHQMVYAALEGRMGGELHALQLTTKTPDQE